MRLNQFFEARKPAPPQPVDFNPVVEHLKAVAEKLVRRPFDLQWDFKYGHALKRKAEAAKKNHEDNHEPEDGEFKPLDDRDLYLDFLPEIWRALQSRTFSAVRPQIDRDILDYQKRHGERLDREAGHEHDMHYIEDSDWLRAMDTQKRVAETLARTSATRHHDIRTIVTELEAFISEWPNLVQTDQRDEPMIVEAMGQGLAAAIPLMILVTKKVA